MVIFTTVIYLFSVLNFFSESNQAEIELWKYEDLNNYVGTKNGKVLIVNFWATWCGPCIKEMPYFEELAKNYSSEVTVLFVSLDFGDQLEKKVIPFVEKKEIKSKVVILDDGNYNDWIDKVSKDWSGAIPATMFVNKERSSKQLYEQEFNYEGLEKKLNEFK